MAASFVSGGVAIGLFEKILRSDRSDVSNGDFVALRDGRLSNL